MTRLWQVLDRSVELFGKNRVFSNVIIGLGETDAEMEACIRKLTSHGVIPVLRPLNPVADLAGTPRPSAERLKKILAIHGQALDRSRARCPAGTHDVHQLCRLRPCAGEGRMKGVDAIADALLRVYRPAVYRTGISRH